jgi:hypothetical protein
MTELRSGATGPESPQRTVRWVAAATALLAIAALALGITTPPRSGALCRDACVAFPYTDVAAFVPRDYWWMYPGLLLPLMAVMLVLCLRHRVVPERVVFATTAVCLTAIGAAVLVVDYGVQLTVVQPALLAGETDGLSLWSQYNPHGLFIALENIGYALLAAAMLLTGVALGRQPTRLMRLVRTVFTAAGALGLAALVVLAAVYRADLDVRYEVTAILVTWLALIVAGVSLALESGHRVSRAPRSGARSTPGRS